MSRSKEGTMATDRPERFAKQLAGHWARKTEQATVDGATVLTFASGNVVSLRPEDGALRVEVSVAGSADLDLFARVVAEHLQRFGHRDELAVAWATAPDVTPFGGRTCT